MNSKYTYMDRDGFMHLSCPVCLDEECEGHPSQGVIAIPRASRKDG